MRRPSRRMVRPHLVCGNVRRFESLETRVLLAGDVPPAVQNPTVLMYFDDDGQATTADAQAVLQAFNSTKQGHVEGEGGEIEIEVARGTSVVYDANDGSLSIISENPVTTVQIVSESGIFTGDPGQNLTGVSDIDEDHEIFKRVEEGFRVASFGAVAVAGLSEEFIRSDLTIDGSIVYPDPDHPGSMLPGRLSNKKAQIRLQVSDVSGAQIREAEAGDEFYLRVFVEDRRGHGLRPNDVSGVFAAYLDVTWDSTLADPIGAIEFSGDYSQVKDGRIAAGLIDELGAVATSGSGLQGGEFELARIRFRATKLGSLTFRANPADSLPSHHVLLFGEDVPARSQDLEFIDSTPVEIDSADSHDLVQFAKDLTASGVVFYGASWCAQCTKQKEMFEDGQRLLPFVEVTNPDRTQNQIGIDNRITEMPTWVFTDGSRLTGLQTLEVLSARSGVPIPASNLPSLAPIEDLTLLAGSPLHIPLDGYDPNGGALTYVVASDNPRVSASVLPSENSSMRIDVEGYGEMVFRLFDDLVPRVTERIETLSAMGFYDGLILHRVIDDFVIQGGDPTGSGIGGSDLPDFDDQYHASLQHNRTGVLSMAKAGDDTNNSQFFIAEGPQRHLDFNYSVFGQLVEGESIRDAISNTSVTNGRPDIDVVMETVEVFNDIENGLLRIETLDGAAGPTTITVTVRDLEGHSSQQSFLVDVMPDSHNGGPFLADIPPLLTFADEPLDFVLPAIDVEGDPVVFSGIDGPHLTVQVDPETGHVVATPAPGFVGIATATVGVTSAEPSDTSDPLDAQVITVEVAPRPIGGPRVIASTLTDGVRPLTRDLTIQLQFDRPLMYRVIDPRDTQLIAKQAGLQRPVGFSYNLSSRTLRVRYENLPLDNYTFVLKSSREGFVGEDGAPLDGENADNQLPSGDGVFGGDYIVEFTTGTGDLDRNGTDDLLEVQRLCARIRVGLDDLAFDYDGNGELDEDDLVVFLDRVLATGPGDANLDGVFDSSDLVQVFIANEYDDGVEDNSGWYEGDWNCDGDFDSSDLVKSFAGARYVSTAQPASREVAAALNALYADQDSKPRTRRAFVP